MSKIPTKLTPDQFAHHVEPHLSKAKRGYVSTIPLYKIFNYILYVLHTGCQWAELPIDPDPTEPGKSELSYHAVYYHFRKWSRDDSLKHVWTRGLVGMHDHLDCSELTLDGTHTLAKKGGESVAYQGRKKAKTSNILPLLDKHGSVVASTGIIAGNHNDAYNLAPHLRKVLQDVKRLGLSLKGAYFNADMAFDTHEARQICFQYGLRPNIPENPRNRKTPKRGRKRLFNAEVYKRRWGAERTFAWVDMFKRLLVRFERKDIYFFGFHCLAFAMINLRHVLS
jgi:transposase